VGRHAEAINRLAEQSLQTAKLRERMGHTRAEILAGIMVGIASAWVINYLFG
jgi:hypothetical protein